MYDFAIVFVQILSSLLSIAILVYFLYKYNRIESRNKETGVHLSYQREKFEDKLQFIESQIAMDGERFADTNHLLLKEKYDDSYNDGIVPNFRFFSSLGIDILNVKVNKDAIGCIMPFHKRYARVYDKIKHICERRGYECHRSDETFAPDNILKTVLELISTSRFIIAVIDSRNPNVYYELGICHALGKKVILVANAGNMENIPFDIASNNRIILYKSPEDLEQKLSTYLKELPDANK